MPISGIYLITVSISGMRPLLYVGQSVNCRRRWTEHRGDLRRGDHGNRYMQRVYNKYGLPAFSFEVLEEGALENLNVLEQWWLDQMCGHPKSLNLASVAEAPARGQKRSSVTKAKLSEAAISRIMKPWTDERKAAFSKARTGAGNPSFGKPRAKGISTRRRPVERTDVALHTVTLYSSLSDVKKDGFNPFSVASACKSDRIHRGSLWKFTKNDIE